MDGGTTGCVVVELLQMAVEGCIDVGLHETI